MSNTSAQNRIENEGENLNIKDFLFMCLAKWHWFIISLAAVLLLATFYILRTQPSYTRSSQVMIKSDSKGSSISGALSDFSDMGFMSSSSSVANEIVAIQSPAIMSEVVRRLHLDMNYSIDGTFHRKTLYGKSLPVNVTLVNVADNEATKLTLDILSDGSISLSDFEWNANGKKMKSKEAVKGNMLQMIETPIGKIVVSPTPNYNTGEATTIYINRNGYHNTTQSYLKCFTAALNNKKNDIIDLSITDVSPQRAVEILNTIIDVYNEKWIEDKNKINISTSH
ncbi:MAG: chromosome partitioning protein ParA, partial [Bacteroidaceae bacterium]|nr:chromosome partitioning protein ParA [Bacteroidaceae bacterium]